MKYSVSVTEDDSLKIRQKFKIQLNDAPTHFSVGVRNYFNSEFPNK